MVFRKFFKNGGGASPLSRQDKGFSGFKYENTAVDNFKNEYYNSNMMIYSSKNKGFTLAEVLITLGIIGVIAAMTIPTLIANYQEKQTITRLQKAYATLKNAFELAKVDHGDYSTWSWNQHPSTYESPEQYFWENYILPYLKVAEKHIPDSSHRCAETVKGLSGYAISYTDSVCVILNDGTSIYSWVGGDAYYPHVWIYVDVNGKSEPNVVGKDVFAMYFSPGNPGKTAGNENDDGEVVDADKPFNIGYGLKLFGEGSGFTAEEMMEPNFVVHDNVAADIHPSCSSKGYGQTCGAVIQLSGWKFPDGYPR